MTQDQRPLVAHVMHRFDVGGLENGVVNLINRLPPQRLRHAVIALTDITDFKNRIERDDVQFVALHKPPGQGLWLMPRMHQLLRQLRPAIVHTRNLAALEMQLPAALAGVPARIHGEHGWDSSDPEGRSRKFRLIRRTYRPFVHRYVALSQHLEHYLSHHIGISSARMVQIYNGVDTERFQPAADGQRQPITGSPFAADPHLWLVGTVGRLQAVKDQWLLARALVRALELAPHARARLRLVVAGEGPLRAAIEQTLEAAGVSSLAWLAGSRQDVPNVLRGLNAFVLPSQAEGVSNTLLEAMATALPVVATRVGGNAELLADDTGRLVPPQQVDTLAEAMLADLAQPEAAQARGQAARRWVEQRFSLNAMVRAYADLYETALASKP